MAPSTSLTGCQCPTYNSKRLCTGYSCQYQAIGTFSCALSICPAIVELQFQLEFRYVSCEIRLIPVSNNVLEYFEAARPGEFVKLLD